MKRLTILLLLLLATQSGYSEGLYLGGGYDFVPGSADFALGYQANNLAVEMSVLIRGKEEPVTKPGPQISLNVLSFIPSQPIFVKAGVVTGMGKNGYDLGAGFDYAINDRWGIRNQVTHYRVTEDAGQAAESENLISVGLKYQF